MREYRHEMQTVPLAALQRPAVRGKRYTGRAHPRTMDRDRKAIDESRILRLVDDLPLVGPQALGRAFLAPDVRCRSFPKQLGNRVNMDVVLLVIIFDPGLVPTAKPDVRREGFPSTRQLGDEDAGNSEWLSGCLKQLK